MEYYINLKYTYSQSSKHSNCNCGSLVKCWKFGMPHQSPKLQISA